MTRIIPFVLALTLLTSCGNPPQEEGKEPTSMLAIRPDFDSILSDAKLSGEVLIYSPDDTMYYANNFDTWQKGSLPASTFKIVNSVIGMETGVLADTSKIFIWNGEPRRMKIWEKDMNLQQAYQNSCVPCYQELARAIGIEQMNSNLKKLDYGTGHISDSMLDIFWLEGDFNVSPWQQVYFLLRLNSELLPIAPQTYKRMKTLMFIKEQNGASLYGKTGWSIRDGNNTGWFVGYVENGEQTYFFATRVDPTPDFDMKNFYRARMDVTLEAFKALLSIDLL